MNTKTLEDTLKLIKKEEIKFIDLRFTDALGKEQHMSVGVEVVDKQFFEQGKAFDGSSIAGWKNIDESDMILMPDLTSALVDPFFDEPTLLLRCDIVEPSTMQPYSRDPRSLAKRAEKYLQESGIADTYNVGPEPEFFVFDDVRWEVGMGTVYYAIDSKEAAWNSGMKYEEGNIGHRPRVKGGYFPVPPVDSSQDLRSAMCMTMKEMGLVIETHHHEVATSNQNEIGTQYGSLLKKADELQIYKYVVHNVAHLYGKTATFMPKPLLEDNGNGMHCHISLMKNGQNIFAGDRYAGLSELALYYIGGVIRHAHALNAFTNPSTNSYKRLVPGFEAPVMLVYSKHNRSAAIRVPHCAVPKAARIEIRFPDPVANPYFAFSAMMMAGLDGILKEIDPGEALEENLYEMQPKALKRIPTVAMSLADALIALETDHEFLLAGDVFNEDLIRAYIRIKQAEVDRLRFITHPVEFDMYYSS